MSEPLKTREQKLAYQRGYCSGAKWPLHQPPLPPDPLIREMMEALLECRNSLDGLLATFDDSDGMERKFGPAIDAADEVLTKVGQWLKEPRANL